MASSITNSLQAAAQASQTAQTTSHPPTKRRAAEKKPYFLQIRIDNTTRRKIDQLCLDLDTNRTAYIRALLTLAITDPDVAAKVEEELYQG